MPDKVEQVLRAIHLLFSEADQYENSPDRIIINKKEMFGLLEKLNYAVMEVMEEYEATMISKERAKMEMESQGQKIIEDATNTADDIYAAAILYTQDAIDQIHMLAEESKRRLQEQYAQMGEQIDRQMSGLKANRDELLEQLGEMAQDKKYLRIIEEENRKQRRKQAGNLVLEKGTDANMPDEEERSVKKEEIVIKVNEWPPKTGKKKEREAAGIPEETLDNVEHIGNFSAEDFDLDMEFFQWQEEQEGKNEHKEAARGGKRSFFGKILR